MFGICSCKLPVALVQIFPGGSEMRRCSVMPHHGHFDGESSQVLVYLFSMSCCAISLHALSTSTFGNPQKYTPAFCTFTTVTASKKKSDLACELSFLFPPWKWNACTVNCGCQSYPSRHSGCVQLRDIRSLLPFYFHLQHSSFFLLSLFFIPKLPRLPWNTHEARTCVLIEPL